MNVHPCYYIYSTERVFLPNILNINSKLHLLGTELQRRIVIYCTDFTQTIFILSQLHGV